MLKRFMIEDEDMEIISSNMPESFKRIYNSGKSISVKILRREPLKKYGDELNLRIEEGSVVWADLFIEENIPMKLIVKNIIGHFLYGKKGKIIIRKDDFGKYKEYATEDFALRFSL